MTMKNDTKIEEKLTCHFKIDMKFTKFDPSTRKSIFYFFKLAPCDQSIYCLSYKSTEELSFMTLGSYANFERRLTSGLRKDMKNLANFHQSTWKCQIWWDPFVQSRKGMTLKFIEELCVMTMKSNAKFEEDWHGEFNKFWLDHSKI